MHRALAAPRPQVRSAEELRHAVRHAGGVLPVDASGLDRVLRLDTAQGLVEAQAGVSWSALATYLRPSAPDIARCWEGEQSGTAAIATSVNANGPGPDGRPVIAHIESLALVTADGELRRVNRVASAELFALVVGGQGLFGAMYSVTLRLDSLAFAALSAVPAAQLAPAQSRPHARRVEILVPPPRLQRFLDDTRARCAEWRVAVQAVEARTVFPESESFLAWARREYCAVTLTLEDPPALGGCVRSTQLRREIIDLAIAHEGSFPIARTRDATRVQVEACYPAINRFLAEKRRYDPAERLVNEWYLHHRSLLRREICNVRFGS